MAGGGHACTLECLSTSALLPCDETGTLWEPAGSGSLYVQGTEGELRRQTAKCTIYEVNTTSHSQQTYL